MLDCGARHVACGIFGLSPGGRLVLRRLAFEPHGGGPAANGNWNEATGRALAALARREKFGGPCRLTLPGHQTLVKFVRTPLLKSAGRASTIEFEARQNIPCPLEQVVWDHLLVADDGADLELMLAAVKSEMASAFHEVADSAGFRADQMIPSSLALLQAFRYNHPAEQGGALVAEIGARSTHLVFIEGERFFIRTCSLGGDAVTRAIAEELQVEFEAAESLKTRAFARPRDIVIEAAAHTAVWRAVAQFTERLHLEIVRSSISCRRHAGASRPVVLHLTGGGSLVPELTVTLADKLALRVVRFDPLREVVVQASARELASEAAPRLGGLVGLATRLVGENGRSLNLLPPVVAKVRAARRRQPVLLAAATLAVAAPLPVIWYYHRAASAANRTSSAIERRLVPIRARAARNARNLARIAETKRRIETFRGLVEARSNWVVFLDDLQTRLSRAEDVWLERLQIAHPPSGGVAPERRFVLSGRLLERTAAPTRMGAESYDRIRGLLQLLSESPFIASVENEHFDNAQPGVLRFDFTLVLDPRRPL